MCDPRAPSPMQQVLKGWMQTSQELLRKWDDPTYYDDPATDYYAAIERMRELRAETVAAYRAAMAESER